jgi:hypothetical protein
MVRKQGQNGGVRKEERLAEVETVIRWDRASDQVTIWTADKQVRSVVRRKGWEPTQVSRRGEREVGWRFVLPLSALRWAVKKGGAHVG